MMSCNPVDYVACARSLFDAEQNEARVRAVINRAYYGAFHAAKAYHEALPSPGSVMGANGSHNQLISQLRYPTVSGKERARSVAIGNLLLATCALRVNADYDLAQIMRWQEAEDALSKADQILTGTTPAEVQAKQA